MKKMMKKLFAIMAVISVLSAGAAASFADYDPNRPIDPSQPIMATKTAVAANTVTVNDKLLEGAECYVNESGNVMIPIRAVAENLGFEVGWDSGRITLTKLPIYITFAIGEDGYTFAKTAPMAIGQAPELTNEKTYVPAAFFSEILLGEISTEQGSAVISYGEKEEEAPAEEEQADSANAVVKSVEKLEELNMTAVLVEDKELGEVQLNIGENTKIMIGDEEGTVADLKEGMKLSVEYGEAMTRSLPPQNTPIKVVVLAEENPAEQTAVGTAVVKTITSDAERKVVYVLVEDEKQGEVQLNLSEDAKIMIGEEEGTVADLKEGMKLSVEYGAAMTMSLPPQNNPVRIAVLEEK